MNKLDRIVEEVLMRFNPKKDSWILATDEEIKKALETGEGEVYVDIIYLKEVAQAVAKAIFEEIWRRECPKCGYPELIVTETSSRFPERVGDGFIAMCPKCGSKFTGTLVLTENLEKQFGVEDE